ncbi:MAG: calcium-binding protein [Leptolyngbya sp. SIO3F4]|nr:calcium-binding protein [Leptolyngbya sp. SIO3F4]
MDTLRINNNQIQTDPVELLNFEDRLRVNSTLRVDGEAPAVLTQGINNEVRVRGEILADSTAIRVEGINTEIDNRGLISGDFNGIDVANGDRAFAQIFNRRHGTITSDSRAINIGGIGAVLDNRGLITTTDDPRNGTVYGDVTAENIFIFNRGVIDVGEGNNGDAISLELGNSVNGLIENSGLVQGRGEALGNNQAAALRLYWVPTAGETSTFNGNVINRGTLAAETGPATIIESNTILNGDLINQGLISSANEENGVGVRLENNATITGSIINRGLITGGRDGIDIGNGGTANALIENFGRIDSASRAVNLGGDQNTLINHGAILTTADPRNGTVYGDVTARNITIENSGLIDVGEGNNGDAISLELGAVVNGGIVNTGLIQGRGIANGITNTASAAIRLYWVEAAGAPVSQFIGNIANEGELATENGATVIIDNRVALNGAIINNGLITGGIADSFSGQLAVDARGAASPIALVNTGAIFGDSLLSDNNDIYVGQEGFVNGAVFGNGGNDLLFGGEFNDIFSGGTGDDFIQSDSGDDEIFGGSGNDFIDAGNGNDKIDGGTGLDFVITGAGQDVVTLSDQGFTIVADFTLGEDTLALSGLSVDDVQIDSLFNSTVITATTTGDEIAFLPFIDAALIDADDFVSADNHLLDNGDEPTGTPLSFNAINSGTPGDDFLNGTEDSDQISAAAGNDIINGLGQGDLLNGELGDDIVHGGSSNDVITGGDGNDVLNGGSGDDLIDGGLGSDALFGGAGSDSFIITPNSGVDAIFDFEVGSDRLVFEEGLSLGQVNFVQSGNNTLVIAESGTPLAGLVNVDATALEAAIALN